MNKYFYYMKSPRVVASLVLVVLIAGGFYLSKTKSVSNTSKKMLDTSTWTEYSNDILGFSIKIPKEIQVGADTDELSPVQIDKNWNVLTIAPIKPLNDAQKWNIWIFDNISSESDVNAFIKTQFGKDCSFDKMTPAAQDGVFDISFVSADTGSDCDQTPSVIKYYPSAHRIAEWAKSQDASLGKYDETMADSFRFL